MTLTIVTVSLNSHSTIRQTIESVLSQTYNDIEYILIDGGSKDGTVDIITEFDEQLNYWETTPDSGIAHAMNKGLSNAKGDYVLYLNSDDYLINKESIEKVSGHFNRKYDIIAASIKIIEVDGSSSIRKPRGFSWWMNIKTGFFHQATFCSRKFLQKMSGFNSSYSIEMDYDFFLRAYRKGATYKTIDHPFSAMRKGGISTRTDSASLSNRLKEERKIHFTNCSNSLMAIFYQLYWMIYPIYKLKGRIR